MANQPWTPPAGNTWNDVDILFRAGLGHEMTIPEGDQNNGDFQNSINWLGERVMEIISGNLFQSGDILATFNVATRSGWLLCDHRTIGSSTSGAQLTGNTYNTLFTVLWANQYIELLTSAGSPTTKGASAAIDWAANKRMYLPDIRGRAVAFAGQGNGLLNRNLGLMYGQEYFAQFHDHNVNIISESSLGSYTPEGNIIINTATLNYNPTATVTVNLATLEYNPSPSITVDIATLEYNPSPDITVNPYEGDITPTGDVVVTLANGPITGTISVSSSASQTAPLMVDISGISCEDAEPPSDTPVSLISCSSLLQFDSSLVINNITVTSNATHDLDSNVTVTSSVFTGDAVSIDHTHTASITGLDADFSHTHDASISGLDADLSHTHTASISGLDADLSHDHTGSFVGEASSLAHTHIVDGQTGTALIEVVLYQPTIFLYGIIKI